MASSVLVSVRVKSEMAKRLELLSQVMKRSKSFLAAEALEEYLDIHEWQIQAIEKGIEAVNNSDIITLKQVKQQWNKRSGNSSCKTSS